MLSLSRKYGLFFFALLFFTLTSCARLPKDLHKPESAALGSEETKQIAEKNLPQLKDHPGLNGFYLLDDNLDALVARVAMIEKAGHTIDIQTFLWHNDEVGGLMAYYLLNAADRGVRVRILIDDSGTKGQDFDMAVFDTHPNIEVRLFNPLQIRGFFRNLSYVTDFSRVNTRMHNKTFITDNSIVIIGGRNIGDEYFSALPEMDFADMDVLGIGPVVSKVSLSFDIFWNSDWALPMSVIQEVENSDSHLDKTKKKLSDLKESLRESAYAERIRNSDLFQRLLKSDLPLMWADANVYYDLPEKVSSRSKDLHMAPQVRPVLDQAGEEILIATPYFIPGRDGAKWLAGLKKKGVKIKIMTNSLASTNHSIVHSGYAKYRRRLLNAGIDLFEFKLTAGEKMRSEREIEKLCLHSKVMVIDRKKVLIGSANMDPRSLDINTELGMIIESEELAQKIVALFEEAEKPSHSYKLQLEKDKKQNRTRIIWITEENGKEVKYIHDPANLGKRISNIFFSMLPIENQL